MGPGVYCHTESSEVCNTPSFGSAVGDVLR